MNTKIDDPSELETSGPVGPQANAAIDDIFSDAPPAPPKPAPEPAPEPPAPAPEPPAPAPEPPAPEPAPEPPEPSEDDDLFFDGAPHPADPDGVPRSEDPNVLREKLIEESSEKREYRRQVKQLTQELEQQKQIYQEVESKLAKIDLSQSSAFKQKFDAPIQEAQQRIAEVLMQRTDEFRTPEEANLMARRVLQARSNSDAEDLLQSQISSAPLSVLGSVLARYDDAQAAISKRAAALAEWKATRASIQQEVSEVEAAKTRGQLVEALQAGVESAMESGNPVWVLAKDANRDSLIDTLTGVLNEGNPARMATLVAQGISVPNLMNALNKVRLEAKTLREENARLSGEGSLPGSVARPGARPAPTPAKGTEGKTGEQIISDMFDDPSGPPPMGPRAIIV
jgi:hypothetical protein